MEWWVVLIIAFGLLCIFFSLGLPVAFAFFALNIIGLNLLFGGKGMVLVTNSIFESVASFTLSPIPMFILLGEIFFQSEIVNIGFDAVDKWVGGIRARLLIVTIIFSTIIGAISGAAIAVCAMLGTAVFPEMVRRGYDKKLSMGCIMGGSLLDPLIPPSVLAVVIGSLANVSIAKLLVSGVLPGLMLAAFYIFYILFMVRIKPHLAPLYTVSSTFSEKLLSLVRILPFGFIIFLVMGLMMIGIATPTESAATGVIGAIIMAAFYRRLTFDLMKNSLLGTIKISAMILLIISASKNFSQILAISGGTRGLVEMVAQFQLPPLALLCLLQAIPLFLGLFIDQFSIMLITIPVYLPVIQTIGFDPLWFWCLFLINMTIGGITPPFGVTLYTMKSTAPNVTLEEVYRAAIPFVIIILLGMVSIIIFPEIAVWLPNWIFR